MLGLFRALLLYAADLLCCTGELALQVECLLFEGINFSLVLLSKLLLGCGGEVSTSKWARYALRCSPLECLKLVELSASSAILSSRSKLEHNDVASKIPEERLCDAALRREANP